MNMIRFYPFSLILPYIIINVPCRITFVLSMKQAHASQRDDIKTVLENVQLAVPAFHIYAHKPDCQASKKPITVISQQNKVRIFQYH